MDRSGKPGEKQAVLFVAVPQLQLARSQISNGLDEAKLESKAQLGCMTVRLNLTGSMTLAFRVRSLTNVSSCRPRRRKASILVLE
jgi:hypothetical protein